MTKSVFLIGATGLIGGVVLEHLLKNKDYKVTALVRDKAKAEKLQAVGVHPVLGDLDNHQVLVDQTLANDVVIHTANCDHLPSAKSIVEGLQKKKQAGKKGIYIHTSGSGIISDQAFGQFASERFYDDSDTADMMAIPVTNPHRDVDTFLFESVKNFTEFDLVVVAPTDIYGQTSGNGGISNPISAQIPVAIKAALKHKRAQQIGKGLNVWSNVHVEDLGDLYALLLDKLVKGELKPEDQGYYFAENGEHQWKQVYEEIGRILVKKGIATDASVVSASTDEEVIAGFGFVEAKYYTGTNSRAKATKARKLGWAPKHNDVLQTIEADVDYLVGKQ